MLKTRCGLNWIPTSDVLLEQPCCVGVGKPMDDFEGTWRRKYARQLEMRAGAAIRDQVLAGLMDTDQPDGELDVIAWTREVMLKMQSTLDKQSCCDVMTDCACHYPAEQLEPLRALYERTGDLKAVHSALQEQFESFLRETLELEEDRIDEIISLGWGAAGILEQGRIIATKIPKSGYLQQYLEENDPDLRRSIYCHCPRVRAAVGRGQELPQIYCYCGAGFYKNMWETILQEELNIEVLESVLSGGDVCRVAINLPAGIQVT